MDEQDRNEKENKDRETTKGGKNDDEIRYGGQHENEEGSRDDKVINIW